MLSRREWIGRLLALARVVGLIGGRHAAGAPENKVSKETAKYQDRPQMCGMCKFYIPPGGHAGSGMMGGQMTGRDHMGGMMGGQWGA
jgi:hypothetical protein